MLSYRENELLKYLLLGMNFNEVGHKSKPVEGDVKP
jgi:hypothetical protein